MVQPAANVIGQKAALRRQLIAARRARSDAERAAAAAANEALLIELLGASTVVCGYLPLASEPLTAGLLDRLVAGGSTVLVPGVIADSPLNWCRHPGPTVRGDFGIAEPTGPRLGPAAVRSARSILVPALAVDGAGRRLGRGGGHYDRTLALLAPDRDRIPEPELIAVVFAGELLERLPVEAHDRPVSAVVAAADGIRHFRS